MALSYMYMYNSKEKKRHIPVVGGFAVVDGFAVVGGFAVVDGTAGVTFVGDGASVVSEYSAKKKLFRQQELVFYQTN